MLIRLVIEEICISSDSAGTSGALELSHVLLTIGNSVDEAYGAVRISISEANTIEELDKTISFLKDIATDLRSVV